jgi:hypothetical protein
MIRRVLGTYFVLEEVLDGALEVIGSGLNGKA